MRLTRRTFLLVGGTLLSSCRTTTQSIPPIFELEGNRLSPSTPVQNPHISVTARHVFDEIPEFRHYEEHYSPQRRDTTLFRRQIPSQRTPLEIYEQELKAGDECILHLTNGSRHNLILSQTDIPIAGRELHYSPIPVQEVMRGFSGSPVTTLEGKICGVLSHINTNDNTVFISPVTHQHYQEFIRKLER
ncbi:MAG: hypothetical protein LAT82_01695 [Nanoarchaeota archaeon]|nr:hypothetical protein [Nanoarchaeota archaeon]